MCRRQNSINPAIFSLSAPSVTPSRLTPSMLTIDPGDHVEQRADSGRRKVDVLEFAARLIQHLCERELDWSQVREPTHIFRAVGSSVATNRSARFRTNLLRIAGVCLHLRFRHVCHRTDGSETNAKNGVTLAGVQLAHLELSWKSQ